MSPNHFGCNACQRPIPSVDPRINCLDCVEYDLCAKCAVAKRFTHGHTAVHRTRVFRMSGGGAQAPVASSIAIVYPAEQTPIANVSSAPSRRPTALDTFTRQPRLARMRTSTMSAVAVSAPRDEAYSSPPPSYSTTPGEGRAPAPAQIPTGWGPFFAEDMSPTPVFLYLIDAIFKYLDMGRSGYLIPEAYSRFLVDQGYVGRENIWDANLIATRADAADTADTALKRVLDFFHIDYVLRPRPRAAALLPASGGMMPLLTRKGFAEITALELLGDPARGWENLSSLVQAYEVGSAVPMWGPMPRSVLPQEADQRVLARMARLQV
ncbi:hypothetical protein K438DRAFT_1833076 [Mycena galopus ATCC 62051]|nr:hypothetical protein K438DRAFT_1833076 [Mycena galopus ATCC 62051]